VNSKFQAKQGVIIVYLKKAMSFSKIDSFAESHQKIPAMTQSTMSNFHDLYLPIGFQEYLCPIRFEDGMEWDECEVYYSCLVEGAESHRRITHKGNGYKIRPVSVVRLRQGMRTSLPSCLRKKSSYPKIVSPYLGMRRSISFSTIPKFSSWHSQNQVLTSDDMLNYQGPRVSFSYYVSVSNIRRIEDYPLDVRRSLWMSQTETEECIQDARRERLQQVKNRQLRQTGSPLSIETIRLNVVVHCDSRSLEEEKLEVSSDLE
jgi:hypothetical protein